MQPKITFATGKRRVAVAKAKVVAGTGIVRINSMP
jgi:ribosomal protein S9